MWLDFTVHKPLARNYTRARRSKTDGVIVHVSAGEAPSLFGWFSNPSAKASSHFYVRYDGTIEQYIDTDYISWASVKGDKRCISIETEGLGAGEWTQAQLASIARLIAVLAQRYGFPLQAMTSSSGQRGVGYHALGVPGSLWQKLRGVSQTGGELWSKSVGKICPGPQRIKQMPVLLSLASGSTPAPAPTPTPTPAPTPAPASVSYVDTGVVTVDTLQSRLKALGYYRGLIDGQAGPMTRGAILTYQQGQKYHGKLATDGYWGKLEEAHYQWVLALQSAMNQWKTASRVGKLRVDGDYGGLTARMVRAIQTDNKLGAYQRAVYATYGRYKPQVDGLPGKAFCHMVGINLHPYA